MKKVKDEFSHLEGVVSRQRLKQLRWLKAGCCKLCGKPRHPLSKKFCEEHALKERAGHRKRVGAVACKEGMHRGWDKGFNEAAGIRAMRVLRSPLQTP